MKNVIKSKWNEIINRVKDDCNLTDVAFRTWIKPLTVYSVKNNIATILIDETQQGHSVDLISNRYLMPLRVAIEESTNIQVDIKFVLSGEIDSSSSSTTVSEESLTNKYPFLNSGHSFDTFVVSSKNSMAHAAALAVSEAPTAQVYNPLYIYGGSGLGKTHLMHSIARYIIEKNKELEVMYVTSETFTNEVIEAIRTNRTKGDSTAMKNLKAKYRTIDVLLVDDIQFIIGKESTQEEFFHTFNALHESGKQIIISSDKPPRDMELLEERLRSRFLSGLPVDIQPPDYETSMAILKKLQEKETIILEDKILSYISSNIRSNVRELEGAFRRIILYSKLNHVSVDLEHAEIALKDIISPNDKTAITPEYIIEIVADHFSLEKEALYSEKRTKEIAGPRQICMYLCDQLTNLSQQDIATSLKKKNHTTVIHAINKVKTDITVDESVKNTIEILKKKINP